jgi:hypothetical protein
MTKDIFSSERRAVVLHVAKSAIESAISWIMMAQKESERLSSRMK